jgi:hypothetical protein
VSEEPDRRVELLRCGIQAYDAHHNAAVLALLDPEVETVSSDELLNAATFYGPGDIGAGLANGKRRGSSSRTSPEAIVARGRALCGRPRWGWRRGSGIEVSMEVGWVYEMRDVLCAFKSIQPSFAATRRLPGDRDGRAGGEEHAAR